MTQEMEFDFREAEREPPGSTHGGAEGCDRVSLKVFGGFHEIGIEAEEWDAAVARMGGPVYMAHGWLSTWWEFYGKGLQLRLCVFSSGGSIVALLPLYLEDFGLGPWRTRVARLVGASLPPKTFNPPVDPWCAGSVFRSLLKMVFETEKCDLLSLGPVSEDWAAGEALRTAGQSRSEVADTPVWNPTDVRTLFRLPGSFDEYLQSLGSSERKNRLKRVRQTERQFRLTADVVSEPNRIEAAFEEFAQLHRTQWRAIGKGGHFEAWPRAGEYNRVLTRRMAAVGRVRFYRMLLDDVVVSSRYTFEFGGVLFSELPARAIGEPWDKMGIGTTSLLKFNESVISMGISCVDSGQGGYEHKAQLGGEEVPVGMWRIVRATGTSRLRTRCLLVWGRVLNVVCQKIWYRRIVPRLPAWMDRTQRRFWLRYAM